MYGSTSYHLYAVVVPYSTVILPLQPPLLSRHYHYCRLSSKPPTRQAFRPMLGWLALTLGGPGAPWVPRHRRRALALRF
jgi:hypothetical protein